MYLKPNNKITNIALTKQFKEQILSCFKGFF